MPEAEIYFWNINDDTPKLIKVDPDIKKLEEKIDSINNATKRSEEKKMCKFCEYAFACLHLEF